MSKSTNTAIVKGSLQSVAQQSNISLAESFLCADAIVLVDVSGSMDLRDARGGKSRYEVACQELEALQATMPGKIAVVAFSTTVQFCPGGVPYFEGAGTNLADALEFVRPADGTVRFIVISDGEPNDEMRALRVARTFTSKIDTIYCGPETERYGALFLARLAAESGGKHVVADRAHELADQVQRLLTTGS